MHSILTRAITLVGLAVCSLNALAQTAQPGLWEITRKAQSTGSETGAMLSLENQNLANAEMQQQMAKMPPAQRQAMEETMRKNAVINMNMRLNANMGQGGGSFMKVCLTQDMIDRKDFIGQTEGKCTRSVSPVVGNTQKFSFTCTDPASSGEGSVTFQSKTNYTSALKVSSVRNGKPESMSFVSTATFLNANCGAVKPIDIR